MATIVREGRLFPSGRCTQADCPKRRSLGTGRRQRIFQAAQKRAVSAPVDLRYVKRPYSDKKGKSEDCVRGDVVSFLGSLWASVAETLPDVRDDTFDDVDPEALPKLTDSYSIELNVQVSLPANPSTQEKVKKPRKVRKGVLLNPDRAPGSSGEEVRKLPPGSMKEYYEQYKLSSNLGSPASFPTFWRAAWSLVSTVFVFKNFAMTAILFFCDRQNLK